MSAIGICRLANNKKWLLLLLGRLCLVETRHVSQSVHAFLGFERVWPLYDLTPIENGGLVAAVLMSEANECC